MFRDWIRRWRRCASLWAVVDAVVDFVWVFVHILWVCRISVASVALGFILFKLAPQARDLFRDVPGYLDGDALDYRTFTAIAYALGLWVTALLFWSIPVHTMARWSIDFYARHRPERGLPEVDTNDPAPRPAFDAMTCDEVWERTPALRRVFLITWIPRLLGLLCFAVLFYGLMLTNGEHFDNTIKTTHLVDRQYWITLTIILVAVAFYIAYILRRFSLFPRHGLGDFFGAPLSTMGLIAFGVGTLLLVALIINPHLSNFSGRLGLAPVVLGGWVPLLSLMTSWSYRLRVPIVTLIFGFGILTSWLYDPHTVRTLDGQASEPRATFDQAVERWQAANGCANEPDACPRPIIVAAAGGASRAAFTMATTLGLLMDVTCGPAAAGAAPCGAHPAFSDKIFAISAVSGAALGAGVFAATLRDFQERPGQATLPCRSASRFWLRDTEPKGWRECMQAILADDFLSPAVLGLAFRDQLPGISAAMDDRVNVLEESWIRAFKNAVLGDAQRAGLDASFDSLMPQPNKPWRPLLVLNGTSTGSGRRILTSHVPFGNGAQPLFADAYDIVDLFAGEANSSGPRVQLRIATGISNSARFPIISPPGVIRTRAEAYVDRIVDGGYFENFGITSANEIALALEDKKLRPAILLITNDPIAPERIRQLDVSASVVPLLPESTEKYWVTDLTGPFLALYNTRSSRGDLAVIRTGQLSRIVTKDPEHRLTFSIVTVYGEPVVGPPNTPGTKEAPAKFKDVSMSWWMSKPMQEYIDRQLVDASYSGGLQQCMLRRVCTWLKPLTGDGDGLAARCTSGLNASFQNPAKIQCTP